MLARRISAFLMAVVILWSSAGATVYQHICLSSDLIEASFWEIDPCGKVSSPETNQKKCCDTPATTNGVECFSKKCCDLSQSYNKVTTESFALSTLQAPETPQALYLPLYTVAVRVVIPAAILSAFNQYSIPTKPVTARDKYALLQTYRC